MLRDPRFVRAALTAIVLCLVSGGALAQDRRPFGDELSREHFGRDRTVDVEHYRLDLAFDPAEREVRGTVSIRMSPLNDGTAAVELDAGPMEIESVTLDPEERSGVLAFRHDGEVLRVDLGRSYRAGETFTLNIRYAARPRSGLYFVGPDEEYPDKPAQIWSQGESEDNHYWFPSFDYPNERATSEEIYTVPSDWTAVGNGELLEVREDEERGTRSFHYRMDVPHVAYLVSVVAGQFETYTEEYDGIPLEYLVPAGTGEETALRSFGVTPDILQFFSERIGVRYPYARYAQACAVDFIFGGMENISATTQSVETLHDEVAALEFDSWGLVAHEAAHQWWGDLLTCASWSHAWLNEGFATYWENLWREHYQGVDEFRYQMLRDRDSYLDEDRDDYRRAIVEHRYTDPMDLFDSHLYPKGAWVLHMIRGILGDEAFFRAMAYYAETYRERVVETEDLRRAISDSTGVNLERFFGQWLGRGGHPEFRVTRDWDPDEMLLTLHVEQAQEVDDLTPVFALPVRVAVDTAEGAVHRTMRIERASQDLTFALESEPLLVRFDPEFQVLMELDLERPAGEMVLALDRDPNPVGRIFAARDLARKASRDQASPGLSGALAGDPFWGVRVEAATALGIVRGDAARDALILALGDEDARVRTSAAKALGEFRDDEGAADALRDVLASRRAYGTRAAAVLGLARIGAKDARNVAMNALEEESYRDLVRAAALEALAELEDPKALPTVRAWMAYGKPPRARLAAIDALPKLAPEGPERERAIRDLIQLLDDPFVRARTAVMRSLAALRAEEALEPLARAAEVEPLARHRRQARRSMREIREGSAADKTIRDLNAEVERLRRDLETQSNRLDELEKRSP